MADGMVEGSLMPDTSMPHSFAAIISVTYIITWIERDNTERGNKRDRTGRTPRDNCLLLRMRKSTEQWEQLWELVTVSRILSAPTN